MLFLFVPSCPYFFLPFGSLSFLFRFQLFFSFCSFIDVSFLVSLFLSYAFLRSFRKDRQCQNEYRKILRGWKWTRNIRLLFELLFWWLLRGTHTDRNLRVREVAIGVRTGTTDCRIDMYIFTESKNVWRDFEAHTVNFDAEWKLTKGTCRHKMPVWLWWAPDVQLDVRGPRSLLTERLSYANFFIAAHLFVFV